MSQSALQRNQSSLQLANFVDWNDTRSLKKLRRKLYKSLKKILNVKSIRNNRINTFEVISADLSNLPTTETRIAAENAIVNLFEEYASNINKLHKANVEYNGDSQYYYPVIKSLGDISLKRRLTEIQHQKIDEVLNKICEIISSSFVTTWSLASTQPDKIIIGEFYADVVTKKDQNLDDMVDELLISNIGRNFLPFTHQLISQTLDGFIQLKELMDVSEISEEMSELLPVFVGSISGFQESLKLIVRQVIQITRLLSEARDELSELDSEKLKHWLKDDEIDWLNLILDIIEQLNELLIDLKDSLRHKQVSSVSDNKNLLNQLMELRAQIAATRLWAHRFEDIPSFTTMNDGIAFEEVDGEQFTPSDNKALIEGQTIFKNYKRGNSAIYALRGVDLKIYEGEFVMIKGPSGSGKTTLLSILAGLETVNRGAVFFRGNNLIDMSDNQKSHIRRDNFAFIFQNYALIPHLTAFENTKLPLEISGLSRSLQNDIQSMLDEVGIGEYFDHKPAYLSGGQMQRLGIARALASKPKIIFADEATGDLDRKTSTTIMNLLKKFNEETGVTIVFVTHDDVVASYGTREIYLEDGQIRTDVENSG